MFCLYMYTRRLLEWYENERVIFNDMINFEFCSRTGLVNVFTLSKPAVLLGHTYLAFTWKKEFCMRGRNKNCVWIVWYWVNWSCFHCSLTAKNNMCWQWDEPSMRAVQSLQLIWPLKCIGWCQTQFEERWRETGIVIVCATKLENVFSFPRCETCDALKLIF